MAQDPNDDLIQEQAARNRIQRQRAAETLYGVRGGNPEAAALASRAAERLGLPTMFVQQDPTLLQSAQAERDLEALDEAPATSSFMANENNALVAHDQVQSLSFLERQLGRPFGELLQHNIDTPVNLARGIGSRAINLGAGFARTAATLGQPVVSGVRDAMRSAGIDPVEINIGTSGITVNRLADTPSGYSVTEQQALRRGEAATLGYVPETTWEEVKQRPIQSFIPFALEQGIVSAPDMAAVLINLPAYVAARTGELGQTRAGNDARTDATVGDLVAAAPAAVGSALLERLGTRGILGLDDVARSLREVPGAIGAAVLKEGLTEAGQEGIEYTAETLGTQTGFDPMQGADRALAGFVGGAGFGGSVRSVTAPLQAVTTQAALREQAVADAERFDQIATGVLENPLLERAPERLREFLSSATNGQEVFVPASTVSEFFQSNPDLDPWLDEWNIRDQVEAARLGGGDIAIPISTYLTQVLPTQADAAFRQDLRLGADAMSLREATESEAEGSSAAEEAVETAVRAAETAQAEITPQARVYDDAFRQFRNAGYTIDAANAQATVLAVQSRVRAERNPNAFPDAYAAYTERPLTIRLELPDSVRQSRDRADVLIEAVRRGDRGPSEREMFGPSLAQFVASNGGVTDEGGDLASFGADRWHVGKPGQRRLIRAEMGSGFTADVVARRAADAGYLPEGATELELRAALEREVRGQPVYSAANEADTRAEGFSTAVRDLETTLGQLGIDPRTETNEEIKAALDRAVTGSIATPFEQAARGSIELGDTQTIIRLFQSRNLSTALHESSHLWLDQLVRDATRADAPEQVRADAEAVIAYGNATLGTTTTLEDFATMTVEEQTPIQELFARTGEAYLLEGKAPSVALRSAFGRFRSWLTRIYRSVKALNVPINDEIRSVFDRLLASDEEIADARAADHLNPLFADAAAAGMTTQEFERFTRKTNQAQQEQREKLDAKLMETVRRKTTQEWRAQREALREGAEREIDQQPDIAAMAYLRDNDVQMSREAVVDLYGSDAILSLLPRGKKSLVSNEGGLHPDVLADLVGERSGEELLNRLQEFQAERVAMKAAGRGTDVRKARIEALLDKDMTELYGDPLTDGTLEREAQAAVHTRQQAELLATESNTLAKMADASGVWTVDMMQDFARRSVGQQRALKLKPWLYLKAERKAGLAAQRAFGKQDFKAALEAKLQQQVNFHLYRAALDAETQVAKADALFTKIMRAKDGDTAKRRDFNMVQAARGIMGRYGLVRANQNPAEYLELLREYDPDAAATLEPYINGAVMNAQPVEEMTYDDFTDMAAVVRQLWDMSRRAKVAEIDGKRVEVAKIVEALQGDLLAKGPPRSPRGQDGAITDKEKLIDGFLGLGAFVTKVEEWATRKGRAFTDYVWSPVSTAAGEYRAARNVYLPKLLDSLNAVRADIGKPFRIDAPEIGYTFGRNRGAGLAELLGAMRHLGNESNRRKLLLGRGWGKLREDGSVDSTGFDAFMTRMQAEGKIQKKHWDYVQAEWDLHEEIKPLAQRAHRTIYGRYFAEVTADPVSTPYGTYAGGYVAAKVDPALSTAADARQAGDLLTGGRSGSFQFPGPANGFTKSRVEYNAPLDLDIRLALSQMDEVLKFAHLGPAVHDVNRILLNREFKPVLDAYDSNAWLGLLLPWLERSVRQQTSTASRSRGGRFFDSVVQWIGRNTGMSIMFGSLLNTVQQVTGFGPAMLRTGKGNMAMALGQYLANPAGVSRGVREASTLMEDRATNQMTELTDAANAIVLNPNLYEKGVTWTVRHAYFLQHAMQNVMDPIIWIAARSKAVQAGDENPERYADSVIRTTQGSRNPEDITNFSTGPKWAAPFKAFTGYFIDQANLLDTEWQKAGSVGRRAEVYALGFFVPAVIAKVLAEAVGGRLEDDEDDGWGDELFNLLVMSQIQYSLAMIPLFGQGANLAINRFDGKMYNDRLSVAPFVSVIEATSRVPYDFYKLAQGTGDASDTTKDVLTAVSLAAGLPTPSRQAGYVADVLEGDVEPTGPVDATRGFLTGSASPGSRE